MGVLVVFVENRVLYVFSIVVSNVSNVSELYVTLGLAKLGNLAVGLTVSCFQ